MYSFATGDGDVLLTTFKVGGTGLDFVAATRVFILDPILADNALLAQAKCECTTESPRGRLPRSG